MTNITLSIEDKIYEKMRSYSEIKWSEFVRKSIKKRIEELEKLDSEEKESLISMLVSEISLKEAWDNEYDERWDEVL
ncbi:hypothetical protein HYU23_03505 [Candidatus Woesearchaeota archaeon]|nr:hypothetical protein [Candidatus Woesearchaeota archaeon]